MTDQYVVAIPLPGSLSFQDLYREQRLPEAREQPFGVKPSQLVYLRFGLPEKPSSPLGVDFARPELDQPATRFATREEAERTVRETIAKGKVTAETGGDPGATLQLQFAVIQTVQEMDADANTARELEQAKIRARAEQADQKVEQAKREADKIRAQLSEAPQAPIPTAAGGWVRHAGGEQGIQERHRADGTTTYRKRATVAGKTLTSPSYDTLEAAIAWEPENLREPNPPERTRPMTDAEIASIGG
jgi:hypothetical protein